MSGGLKPLRSFSFSHTGIFLPSFPGVYPGGLSFSQVPFLLSKGDVMNDDRRKRIRKLVIGPLTAAMDALDEIKEEEESYAESIPFSFEARKEESEAMTCVMEEAKEEIETQKNAIAELVGDDG
jgi:hypothetical protein